jgi:hypothetical protein
MTAMKFSPVTVPVSKTGFGFDQIMRKPDYSRFPAWYATFSRLAPQQAPVDGTASVAPFPGSTTGFGFDRIMRNPDHTRFPTWYARSSRLAAEHPAATEAAGTEPEAHFELDKAA